MSNRALSLSTFLSEKEKLTSPPNSNFDAWVTQILDAARVAKVWKIINGEEQRKIVTIPPCATNVSVEAHREAHQELFSRQEKIDEEWEDRCNYAIALLRMNLSSQERQRVSKHAVGKEEQISPAELYAFLKLSHKHATTGQVFSYTMKFFSFKTSDYPSINEAYEALTAINAELRQVKNEQSEQNCKFAFLHSLPTRFEARVDHLKTQMDTRSLYEMKLELEDKEREILETEKEGAAHVAMIARLREEERAKVREEERTKAYELFAAQVQRNNSTNPRPICEHCHKRGHSKDACWELKPELKDEWEKSGRGRNNRRGKGKTPTTREGDSMEHEAHFASQGFEYVSPTFAAMSASSAYWIVDSGASTHLSPDKENFVHMSPLKEPISIYIGDGRAIQATHRGVIQLLVDKHGGNPMQLTFDNALYVPHASVSLLSVGQASKAGLNFSIIEGQMNLIDGKSQKTIHQIVPTEQNMYRLHVRSRLEAYLSESGPQTWTRLHQRFGHLNERDLKALTKCQGIINLQVKKETPLSFCDACALGKMKAKPHKRNPERSSGPLARVFIDLVAGPCEAIQTKALWGLHISDDYTKMVWHIPLRSKDEAFEAFTQWLMFIQKQTGHTVRQLRNDPGGEFGGGATRDIGKWAEFCKRHGIQQQFTNPDTPQQNDVERHNQTILHAARTMMLSAGLPTRFWSEAMAAACHTRNMSPASGANGKIPLTLLYPNIKIDVSTLRRFGSQAFSHIHKNEPRRRGQKFAPTSRPCFLVGYAKHTAGYRLYDPVNQEIFERSAVVFNEDIVYKDRHQVLGTELWLPDQHLHLQDELDRTDSVDSTESGDAAEEEQQSPPSVLWIPGRNEEDPPSTSPPTSAPDLLPVTTARSVPSHVAPPPAPRRSARHQATSAPSSTDPTVDVPTRIAKQLAFDGAGRHWQAHPAKIPDLGIQALTAYHQERLTIRQCIDQAPDADLAHAYQALTAHVEPVPDHDWQALRSKDASKWRQAMIQEMESLVKNGTWELTELPPGANLVDNRWVFAHKLDAQGRITRFKARLVAKGFSQRPGVDFRETFAPTARPTSQRLLFALAAQDGLIMHKLDVTTAFLHGRLDEDVYMRQPRGFVEKGKEKLVCKLIKAIYGLKQAARQWYKTLKDYLTSAELGYCQCDFDMSVFWKDVDGKSIYIAVHIDDMAIVGPEELVKTFKDQVAARFPCRDEGELTYHLGVQIHHNKNDKTVTISQGRYARDLIKRAGLGSTIRKVRTPMIPNIKLLPRADTGEASTDKQQYQELVGGLRYLAEWTRPDIAYAAGQVARHLHDPGESHFRAVMHIYRYIAGTLDHSIQYRHKAGGFQLQAYSDASWAEDGCGRRSTTGWLTLINGVALSWRSCKQDLPASSTTEAEWIAGFEGGKEVKWLRQLLRELGKAYDDPVKLFIDNAPVLNLIENPVHHERTKHIDVKAYYLRYLVEKGYVQAQYVQTTEQLADCLTKSLGFQAFDRLIQQYGLLKTESIE